MEDDLKKIKNGRRAQKKNGHIEFHMGGNFLSEQSAEHTIDIILITSRYKFKE
jgi:hypothetical protein